MNDTAALVSYNSPSMFNSYLRNPMPTAGDSDYLAPPLPNNPLSGIVDHAINTFCFRNIGCTISLEYSVALCMLLANIFYSQNTLNQYKKLPDRNIAVASLLIFGTASALYGLYAGVQQYKDSLSIQNDNFDVQDYSVAVADGFVTAAVITSLFNLAVNFATNIVTPKITAIFDRHDDGYVPLGERQTNQEPGVSTGASRRRETASIA